MKVEESECILSGHPHEQVPCSLNESLGEGVRRRGGIDKSKLLGNCVGSNSFADLLLKEFGSSGLAHVHTMLEHAEAEQFKATALAAHSLKGSAGIVGALRLASIAESVERSCNLADRHQLRMHLAELTEEMDECLQQIPAIRHLLDEPSTDHPPVAYQA